MTNEELRHHVDERFDRLETKVDTYAQDAASIKTDLRWLKGHVNAVTLFGLTTVGGILIAYFTRGM